jgi:hypothetical protein
MVSYDPEGTKAALSELPRIDWQKGALCASPERTPDSEGGIATFEFRGGPSTGMTWPISKASSPNNNALD